MASVEILICPTPPDCAISPGLLGSVKVAVGTLKQGENCPDFSVVEIDPETRSAIVKLGEEGALFRIWPAASQ